MILDLRIRGMIEGTIHIGDSLGIPGTLHKNIDILIQMDHNLYMQMEILKVESADIESVGEETMTETNIEVKVQTGKPETRKASLKIERRGKRKKNVNQSLVNPVKKRSLETKRGLQRKSLVKKMRLQKIVAGLKTEKGNMNNIKKERVIMTKIGKMSRIGVRIQQKTESRVESVKEIGTKKRIRVRMQP